MIPRFLSLFPMFLLSATLRIFFNVSNICKGNHLHHTKQQLNNMYSGSETFISLCQIKNNFNYSFVSAASLSIISLLLSPVMQCFSSLLIGDEISSELWVQQEKELLFRQCNIHDVSCGTSTAGLRNPERSRALKTTLTPKETVLLFKATHMHSWD